MHLEAIVGPRSLCFLASDGSVLCYPMLPTWESILDRGPKPGILQACTGTSRIVSQRKFWGGGMYCVLACPPGCHGSTCSGDFLG